MKKILLIIAVVINFTTALFGFTARIDNLTEEETDKFILGKSFYRIPWVEAPSATTARDGLGPLFSANTCMNCHPNNSKGSVYNNQGNIDRSLVVRLSIPTTNQTNKKIGFEPEPTYGSQLSINSIHGIDFEGKLKVEYSTKTIKYPDGEEKELRVPKYSFTNLNYGEMDKDVIVSVRMAPALTGLGLIEKISSEQFLENVDENDKDNDGISGKANYVYDIKKDEFKLGLYTYKASAPTVSQQIASAFHNDMGLTTTYFKQENCTSKQQACLDAPKPRDPIDVTDDRVEAIDFYLTHLKLPKQSINEVGKELFSQLLCIKCHVGDFKSKDGGTISPYSDFLLHDMGEELADGRSEFDATANEWRTTPLWGISHQLKLNKNTLFLHDGRARDIEEAILWHGGEAEMAKESFMQLNKKQRDQVVDFLKGL